MTDQKPDDKRIPFGDLQTMIVDSEALPALEYIHLLVDIFGPEPIIAAVRNHEVRPIDPAVAVEKWIEQQPPQSRIRLIQAGTAIHALERLTEEEATLLYRPGDCERNTWPPTWFVSIDGHAQRSSLKGLFQAVKRALSSKKEAEGGREEQVNEGMPIA